MKNLKIAGILNLIMAAMVITGLILEIGVFWLVTDCTVILFSIISAILIFSAKK